MGPIDFLRNSFSNIGANWGDHWPQQLAIVGMNRIIPGSGNLVNRFYFQPRNLNQTTQHLTDTIRAGNDRRQEAILPSGDRNSAGNWGGGGGTSALANALMGTGQTSNTWNMQQWWGANNPASSSQLTSGLLGGIPNGSRPDYLNSPQAGGNLGIGMSPGNSGISGNNFGYSGAGGGYGAGVWQGGGGTRVYQVNGPSLHASNYAGIGLGGGGMGNSFGPHGRPTKKPA